MNGEVKLLLAIVLGSKRQADRFFTEPRQPKPKKARRLAVQYPKEFAAYRNAKNRCENPGHPSWADYGGRGIKMCFKSFAAFFLAVGPCPDPELTLDRWPKRNGSYGVGNMRWATRSAQAINRRPKVLPEVYEWLQWSRRT